MVAVPNNRPRDGLLVDPDAVGRLVVVDHPVVVLFLQVRVAPGDREVIQYDVVVVGPPDRGDLPQHGEDLGSPFRFVEHLEHGGEEL